MLKASQLARTRGAGEICTKELPHSLAALSWRNRAGEEGLLSPVHQPSHSRQRRFTTTPSRSATQPGQDPSTTFTWQEPKLSPETPKRRASKRAVQCGIRHGFEWSSRAPASSLAQGTGRTSVGLWAGELPGGRRLNPIWIKWSHPSFF